MLVYGQLSKEINSHEGYTLVGIPGHLHHKTLEDTLIKVIIKNDIETQNYSVKKFCNQSG